MEHEMEGKRFDAVVRKLSERGSRRGALQLLGAALAVLAGSQTAATQAKGKGKGRGKGKGKGKKSDCPTKKCPRGQHRNKRTCKCECTRLPCSGGMEFDIKACRCACPSDLRRCGDECIDPDECCAALDEPCAEDPKGCCNPLLLEVCTIDGCCPDGFGGFKVCNGFCIDTDTDAHHCGGCNAACDGGENCVNGKCGGEDACPPVQKKCGDICCEFGEDCCHGVCATQGTATCTADGWCSSLEGQACTVDADEGPCCRFSAGEVCCVTSLEPFETTCCPGPGDQCGRGGCCPVGTRWNGDCEACCPIGGSRCEGCQAPVPGRG